MKGLYILFSLFLFLVSATPYAKAATNDSLVKIASNDAVYYVMNGKRYAFPNEKVFFSWYSDFHSIRTISPSELSNYPLIGNVTYRPGRWLIKIQTDPKVYAVSRYSILHWVTSEQIASALYGVNWAKSVQDVPDTFFLNYRIDTSIKSAGEYSPQTELTVTQIAQNIREVTVSAAPNVQTTLEEKTFELINQHRQSKGLSLLVWDDQIATVARGHSQDMSSGKVAFGHDGFADRIQLLSSTMTISSSAENVAQNSGSVDPAATAVESWLNSPGHFANIENTAYNRSGIGIAVTPDGSYYFTQIFIQSISQ